MHFKSRAPATNGLQAITFRCLTCGTETTRLIKFLARENATVGRRDPIRSDGRPAGEGTKDDRANFPMWAEDAAGNNSHRVAPGAVK
jgi:hypothetical protein